MPRKFWILLRKYCLGTTIEGLKYFYIYPDFLSRCYWSLNLLTATFLSFFITYLLYWRFNQMPTRVTLENQFEKILDLPYPTITLCPSTKTKTSLEYFNESLIDYKPVEKLEKLLPLLLRFYEIDDNLKYEDLEQLQKSFEHNRFTISEVMGTIPLSCERFLKRCLLEGKLFDCKELFKPILTTHGYCCSFNSKYYFNGKRVIHDHNFQNRKIRTPSLTSLFTVVTDNDPEDSIEDTILNSGSIRVMLTDSTEFPFEYESYLVDTNAESFLFLRATYTYCSNEVQMLPWWSRDCLLEDERKLVIFRKYHDSDCELMCYVLAIKSTCDCWTFFLPIVAMEKICKVTHIPCILNVRKNMNLWINSEQCYCPRNCESRKYHAELTVGNFDAIPYMIDSVSPLTGLKLNKSSSIINFLTKPVYVKLKQETVESFVHLFSCVGGVFALFLGCSTLSIFEMLFHIYRGIRQYSC